MSTPSLNRGIVVGSKEARGGGDKRVMIGGGCVDGCEIKVSAEFDNKIQFTRV